jgi:hypothetical protein
VSIGWGALQSVQRGLARERRAIRLARGRPAQDQTEDRIATRVVVVVQVVVAEVDAEDALAFASRRVPIFVR